MSARPNLAADELLSAFAPGMIGCGIAPDMALSRPNEY